MKTLIAILDRAVTSLCISAVLFFVSFSYMTGKFPPAKADLKKTMSLMGQMLSSSHSLNKKSQELKAIQDSGQEVNLIQMVEFQRLALKHSEMTLELVQLFEKVKTAPPNMDVAEHLTALSNNLQQAEAHATYIKEKVQTQ